jgi:hypothetical protein
MHDRRRFLKSLGALGVSPRDSRTRGYVRVELTPQRWSADPRAMQTVQKRDMPCSTLATFVVEVVEVGRPGPLPA